MSFEAPLPATGVAKPPSGWPRSPASTAAPVLTTCTMQSRVSLSSSSSCVCSFPEQRLCCRPQPAKEQSHIVQSKQLPYQLEQKCHRAPRPQSPNPAGQSGVKRLSAARQQNMPLSLPRAFTQGGFPVATPSPRFAHCYQRPLRNLNAACLSWPMGSVPCDFDGLILSLATFPASPALPSL